MKLAMIDIDRKLRSGGFASRLIIQVHDEVLLDCPESELKEVGELVTQAMEGAMKLNVQLRVNSADGANWAEL